MPRLPWPIAPAVAFLLAGSGCVAPLNDPARATRPYPDALHRTEAVEIQVFRSGDTLEIVNATVRSYRDVDVWINQRFLRHVESLLAGQTVRLRLTDFADERGDIFPSAGLFRIRESLPVRLVELQVSEGEPMIGLVSIRAEEVERRPTGF